MIIYLGIAHVVNLSNQNKVIILIRSLSKASSVSLCMRGKLPPSVHGALMPHEGFSCSHGRVAILPGEKRVRGEYVGRLVTLSLRTGLPCLKWPLSLMLLIQI